MDSPQFLATNRDSTIAYSLKYKAQTRIVDMGDDQMPMIIQEIPMRCICKYHVFSGNNSTFEMEEDWDLAELIKIIDFYALAENLVVTISYDQEQYQFSQTVLFLEQSTGNAVIVVRKKFTVSRLAGLPFINTALIHSGKLIICGARADESGKMNRLTLLIPNDPMSTQNHEDISELLDGFQKYLGTMPESKIIALFVLGMTDKEMTVFLCESTESSNRLMTECVGKIDRVTGANSIEKIDNEVVKYTDFCGVLSLKHMRTRGQNVMMGISIPDVEKSRTLWWRIKLYYARFALKVMICGFRAFGFLALYDRGFTFFMFVRFLRLIHGPHILPQYCVDEKLYFYHLDLNHRKIFEIPHEPRKQDMKDDPNQSNFATNFEIDENGGALLLDFPTLKRESLRASYYPNPTIPQKLSSLSMYSAYRNYPSFEKSSLLRRMTGLTDWKWRI
ncbi:unnamed protein product [Caenorhabditis angaria]|uniref:Uncharacterized protein n=1 Tax=Caenorhabditis angaria TaxID=860376 RepID=A0A9P1MZ92_9PELO|nr:unnamed protein product [Caenorhabditis angaria]CAI5444248.1 unnamed protein product [Caenorhabditis angaria]